MNTKRLLILEPYWGGSHRQFLLGLQQNIEANCLTITLPARKWKMRMQLSAPWACNHLNKLSPAQRHFDTVLCSSFMDVATLRALLPKVHGWNPKADFCTYFHENQFAYPEQFAGETSRQFAAINYTTALASDRLAFNSNYNLTTFIDGCNRYLCKDQEMGVSSTLKEILDKSIVLPPGLNYSLIDQIPVQHIPSIPVIVWNQRWEHDKNPEEFFAALLQLHQQGLEFRIIILGQAFAKSPSCFQQARFHLAKKIIHFGYAPTRQMYAELLRKCTIVVSTARHEFFGLAVVEAVRAGCYPLLPDRLAYPEIFEQRYLYPEGYLTQYLSKLIRDNCSLGDDEAISLTEKFSWHTVQESFAAWLFG